MKRKACPLCRDGFDCGADASGCWCERVEVPRERLLPVRTLTDDCLCPRCLAAAAAGRLELGRAQD